MKNILLRAKANCFSNGIGVKISSILMCLFLSFLNQAIAQTLEKVFSNTYQVTYVKLTQSGEKYVVQNDTGKTCKIYNSDFSIYKTIIIPQLSGYKASSNHVSDNLFNGDSKIEIGVTYIDYSLSNVSKYVVYSEDGTQLFTRDSVNFSGPEALNTFNGNGEPLKMYYNTSSGWKLYLSRGGWGQTPTKVEVFSLPGSMPQVTATIAPTYTNPFNLSNPYPNPSTNTASIDFKLPESINEGEIVIYNQQGSIIKTLRVDNTFGMVLLNNSNLPTGTYYYLIKAGNNVSDTKKMVVIP